LNAKARVWRSKNANLEVKWRGPPHNENPKTITICERERMVVKCEIALDLRQRHARHRAHGIIGVSPVSRFPPTATIRPEGESLRNARSQISSPHSAHTGGTPMLLFARVSASRTSPSPWYHRRLACVRFPPTATIRPEGESCPAMPVRRFPALIPRTQAGRLCYFLLGSQRHARHRAHGIIGVSPVSRFPPTTTKRPEGESCPQCPFADFQPSFHGHRRDAYATFRSVSASRTSPSPWYHRRLACVSDSKQRRP
jgi:hypothetical protein